MAMKLSRNIFYLLIKVAIVLDAFPVLFSKNQQSEEMANRFEDDMIFPYPITRGAAARASYQRWIDGTVPYLMTPSILADHSALIVDTMRLMENLTRVNDTDCIKFRPRTESDSKYIIIQNSTGCSATVGAGNGYQVTHYLNLMHAESLTCMISGVIQHELLHILGFFHEQSRPDRDSYVSIQWSNIQSNMKPNFEKYTETEIDTLQTPYDYGSIMHYSPNAFTNNGLRTIIPTKDPFASIGQRIVMSPIDILEVQRYYSCVPSSDPGKALIATFLFIISRISITT
ncbi:unnamed protein product [Rotaria socialis]|uniref:Metalloendopeptidase n=2 Tax=Rotaria socialis TaxID=392032 RepID=A0A818UQ86_9BILA|nr:unnamed protein product [Rotaria socialis]CAF3696111.1 unnamed protein product [Rotaria socialis]CAF4294844.1 unnamed protein product [Rotaria socialis]CAF4441142.1 unnamed protein product [Rotaria socialis]CAF4457673.1 unnamed protein product [Rotaria socialis]